MVPWAIPDHSLELSFARLTKAREAAACGEGEDARVGLHNSGAVREDFESFYERTEVLAPEGIADGVACLVTRPRHTSIGELWIMPTDQV
jgi:NADP-dependent 3-hydroxy acid dehydrogenase YdfG